MSLKEFTKEELKQFDGKNGHKAYVAIEGDVYDVTDIPGWKNGEHHGNLAGNDVTDALLNKSPHGTRVLSKLTKVGKLI
ncbi:cytochrome b5 domain-containing protein [Ligilactobacillus cholophilus]|uniref:cytochrome b5 domain-containing protein n=1 Tax=Ligilactobacillus cholophilus TaxID=3050131 RepID=UPI0025B1045B|nr:cytochrome b5 domain-containing protein [Ligilactobacillus cholophilus]